MKLSTKAAEEIVMIEKEVDKLEVAILILRNDTYQKVRKINAITADGISTSERAMLDRIIAGKSK